MLGISVEVKRPVKGAKDRLGNATVTYASPETVGNVLVVPGATADFDASRPEGVRVAYTLHFPKSYTGDLEGCLIVLPAPYAGEYRTVGKPAPYMDGNTPTSWHMPVEVEAAHG